MNCEHRAKAFPRCSMPARSPDVRTHPSSSARRRWCETLPSASRVRSPTQFQSSTALRRRARRRPRPEAARHPAFPVPYRVRYCGVATRPRPRLLRGGSCLRHNAPHEPALPPMSQTERSHPSRGLTATGRDHIISGPSSRAFKLKGYDHTESRARHARSSAA